MKRKIGNIILNLIITALVISMLSLMLLYTESRTAANSSDKEPFDKLWIVGDYDDTSFSVFNSSLCTPELIAYKQEGSEAGALIADEEMISTLYSVLSDTVLDVFGEKSVCVSQDVDYISAVRELISAQSYILYEYSADIPFPYIYALASKQSTVDTSTRASGRSVYISRLALILSKADDGSTIYSALAFDSRGNAFRFKREDDLPYVLPSSDMIHLDAYSTSFDKAEFVANLKEDNMLSAELIHSSISYSPLQKIQSTSFLGLNDEAMSAEFILLFELNPEKLNSYVERDGTTVFIGTDERITVSPDNMIRYSSSNEYMPLNKILGYTPGKKGSYTLFDMLKATDILINRFCSAYPSHIGKNASIKLTGVYRDSVSDCPVFEYSYFYNGIRIDLPCAFRFSFTADGIKELTVNAVGFTMLSDKQVTLSKNTVFNRVSSKLDGNISLRPVYTPDKNGIFYVDWAAYSHN